MAPSALPATFTVVNLEQGQWTYPRAINASGQVAYYRSDGRAGFYDGANFASFTLGTYAGPTAINSSGQITGGSRSCDTCSTHAFIRSPDGTLTDLGPTGYEDGIGWGISDSGQVAGDTRTASWSWDQAVYWGSAQSTPTIPFGGRFSTVGGMNGRGLFVGGAAVGYTTNAYVWDPGTSSATYIPLGQYSSATSINDAGAVAGYYWDSNWQWHAFMWSEGVVTDLSAIGDSSSDARQINSQNQVLGMSRDLAGAYHWWIWTPSSIAGEGTRTELGSLGYAGSDCVTNIHSMNGQGHAVGDSCPAANTWRAVAWTATDGMVDLNSRMTGAPAGLVLWEAFAINDSDEIVAASSAGLVLLKPGVVADSAPAVTAITASDPAAVGSSVNFSASFTDVDTSDTHAAQWDWGDGSASSAGTLTESGGTGSAVASHTYAAAGTYTVKLVVTDSAGKSGTVTKDVVIYDPAAGFVSGDGWIISPAGAYKADPSISGRAMFAFVSKYLKGATTPSGTTQFKFQAASLTFSSDMYDWLVVSGSRAQYKGQGSLNGLAGYRFILTAVDGDLIAKGTPDRFRIKIWHYDTNLQADVVDYDNQLDSSTIGTNSEGTAVGAGTIVIHK